MLSVMKNRVARLTVTVTLALVTLIPWMGRAYFDGNPQIDINESSLSTRFGQYSETIVNLSGYQGGTLSFEVLSDTLPTGFNLTQLDNSRAQISGVPQFSGNWCFVLGARVNSQIRATRKICYNSQINSNDTQLPIAFTTDRFLDAAVTGNYYTTNIYIQDNSYSSYGSGAVYGTVVNSYLPDGITLENSQTVIGRFDFSGTPRKEGSFRFVLRVSNDQGFAIERQFEITVSDDSSNGNGQQCAPGYAYDPDLGYCAPARGDIECGRGTYYDPASDSCVAYPSPPTGVVCQPGMVFDPYTGVCIYPDIQRCPFNYEWDVYSNRCVRSSYTCGYGTVYDWNLRECVPVFRNTCGPNQYYDPRIGSCVYRGDRCLPGYYWDPVRYGCFSYRPAPYPGPGPRPFPPGPRPYPPGPPPRPLPPPPRPMPPPPPRPLPPPPRPIPPPPRPYPPGPGPAPVPPRPIPAPPRPYPPGPGPAPVPPRPMPPAPRPEPPRPAPPAPRPAPPAPRPAPPAPRPAPPAPRPAPPAPRPAPPAPRPAPPAPRPPR